MTVIPADQIGPLMHQLVPLVDTLGLDYVEVSPEQAVVLVRDQAPYRNHVGGPHAAVLFAVAESATGAVAIANLGDLLDRAVLLPTTVTMDYLAISTGDMTATARIVDDVAQVRATFEAGQRPEFDIVADIANAAGEVTARLSARWTVKALRTG